jgi:hypothetical protein
LVPILPDREGVGGEDNEHERIDHPLLQAHNKKIPITC